MWDYTGLLDGNLLQSAPDLRLAQWFIFSRTTTMNTHSQDMEGVASGQFCEGPGAAEPEPRLESEHL